MAKTQAQESMERSILQMARGAIIERVDVEMSKIVENVLDENTSAEAKRTLTLKLTIEPNEDRTQIYVTAQASSKLAPLRGVGVALEVGKMRGETYAVELSADVPGQKGIFGGEEPEPAELKIVNKQ